MQSLCGLYLRAQNGALNIFLFCSNFSNERLHHGIGLDLSYDIIKSCKRAFKVDIIEAEESKFVVRLSFSQNE